MHRDGKTIFITGTTTGIGLAAARKLDSMGWRVFAGALPSEDTSALRQNTSERLTVIPIDITQPEMIAAAVETVRAAVGEGGLNALHNNAGYAQTGPIEFVSLEALRRQFEVNVFGHVAVTQAFLPLLRAGKGRIVNTVSVLGRVVLPFTGAYSMSKFALEAFTDALRLELAPWQIPVIAIEPASVNTPFFDKAAESFNALGDHAAQAAALYGGSLTASADLSAQMRGRAQTPEQIADVIAEALTVERPKTRYLIGREARLLAFFARWLPDGRRDKAILRQYRSK